MPYMSKEKEVDLEILKNEEKDGKEQKKRYSQVQVKDMILKKLKKNQKILNDYEDSLSKLETADTSKIEKQIKDLEEKEIANNFFKDSIKNILSKNRTMDAIKTMIKNRMKEIEQIKDLFKSITNYFTSIKLSDTSYVDLEIDDKEKLKLSLKKILERQTTKFTNEETSYISSGKQLSDSLINFSKENENEINKTLVDIYWALNYACEKGEKATSSLENFGGKTKVTMGIGAIGASVAVETIAASAITGSTVAGVSVTAGSSAAGGVIGATSTIAATSLLGTTILTAGIIGAGIFAAGLVGYGVYRLIKWIKNKTIK